MDFTGLIEDAHPYLERFDRDHYPKCFSEFEAKCRPFFDSLHGQEPAEAAAQLLSRMEECRESIPRRKRIEVQNRDKRVLALFFSPAARRHSEEALALAEQLRKAWNRKHPKDIYLSGNYEDILRGFDAASPLGLPLRMSGERR